MRKRASKLNGTEDICPSYLRARIRYIEKDIKAHDDKESNDYRLLKYGVIQNEDGKMDDICSIQTYERINDYPPLDFTELTRFNTWFTLHPEKVCGTQIITTSRNFLLSIKGTKEDIINTIHSFISYEDRWVEYRARQKRKSLAKAKALRFRMKYLGFKF